MKYNLSEVLVIINLTVFSTVAIFGLIRYAKSKIKNSVLNAKKHLLLDLFEYEDLIRHNEALRHENQRLKDHIETLVKIDKSKTYLEILIEKYGIE